MRAAVVSSLAVVASVLACASPKPTPAPTPSTAQAPAPAPAGAPGGGPTRPRMSPAQMDSARRVTIARVLADIAGRENEPAERVFKNIKLWKGLPARALVDTMSSYGRAMGSLCTGCHVANQFESDNRKNKGIARQMQTMVNDLNATYLPKMPDLDDDHPPVTCAMCHAGSGHPKKDVVTAPAAAPARWRPVRESSSASCPCGPSGT